MSYKNVLIVGLGTIGEPLAFLLLRTKEQTGLGKIMIHKNTPRSEDAPTLAELNREGAELVAYSDEKTREGFKEVLSGRGFGVAYDLEEALGLADVVIDCTEEEVAMELLEKYYSPAFEKKKTMGFIAQGSAKGFGKPFAYTINDEALEPGKDRFIQVVSCNTHQILCLLKTLIFNSRVTMADFEEAEFTLFRRASDVPQSRGAIWGTRLGRASGKKYHPKYGAHQPADALRVLSTIGIKDLWIHGTESVVNNPFMHTARFDFRVKTKLNTADVWDLFAANPLISRTQYTDNNMIFYKGCSRGHRSRILNQTVAVIPSLEAVEWKDGLTKICGGCFTPQDGNSLLSSVAAMLWLIDPQTYKQKMLSFYREPFLLSEI